MIVLKINKPEKGYTWPRWSTGMNHLDGAEFIFDPNIDRSFRNDPYTGYCLTEEHIFVTPKCEPNDYVWGLNTQWLEVVSTDGEDLSNLEELGIKVPDIFKVSTNGPITLSTIGTYHDRSKD